MKNSFRNFFFLMLTSTALTVIMDPDASIRDHQDIPELLQSNEANNFNEALRTCFAKRNYGTLECINRGALTALQSWNDDDCLDFGNVKLERSEGESRNILDLDWDPKDFGNVMKAASRLLERRNMKWDLSNVYPGLQMRVGPTLSAGNGMLEFIVDERSNHFHNRQVGTGALLMRQLVLPFLLGFKFNLASLLPLLFGVLIIITKKALLLTKIALFIAGLLGWNSLFSGFQGGPGYPAPGFGLSGKDTNRILSPGEGINAINPYFGYGHGQDHHHHSPPNLGNLGTTVLQDQNYQYHQPYRGDSNGFPFGQHIIREIVNVYEGATGQHQDETEESNRRKKNFVWTRNES